MKKIGLFILILFLCNGCSAEYNLTITNSVFEEDVNIYMNTQNDYVYILPAFISSIDTPDIEKEEGKEYYNETIKNNLVNYKYSFSAKNYQKSNIVKTCYNLISFMEENNTISITTIGSNKCFDLYPELTEIKINITTDLEVISNNSDTNNGNQYTWNLNRENFTTKKIEFQYKQKVQASSTTSTSLNKKEEMDNKTALYIIGGVFSVFIITIIFIIRKKSVND